MEQNLAEFCRILPKLELHAHLNGSLSNQTIKELHKTSGKPSTEDNDHWKSWEKITNQIEGHSLEECFQLFNITQSLTSHPAAVFKATQDVIQEFANDGVIYLELRSTPREVPGVMSKLEYIKTIAEAILNSSCQGILVKLIVSLDRRQGKQVAEENLDLVLNVRHQYPDIIVGTDLSGDPNKGNIDDYLPVLERARSLGLKLAVHCAEIPNQEEVMKILQLKPERLGHATCIHPEFGGSETLWIKLLQWEIPVEICLTSNVRCKTVPSYAAHHLERVIASKHPMTLATDDKGVFNTTLSQEYRIAAECFSLSKEDLYDLSLASVEYAFCTELEKMKMKDMFSHWKKRYLSL
ncbi:adenosine deaminase-like protein [Anabrus simplex]|uniref:adenosine deaminase-like protein n=1 Tax=Anabrus simplex TaxID=316456 RepID=UPI0035A3496C